MQFSPGGDRVCLRPNPAFVPKCGGNCETLQLAALNLPSATAAEEGRLRALCPVRALRLYVERTSAWRKGDQLFVSWASSHRGMPISTQRLSHWVVEAITLAYASKGKQSPVALRAHSTRGMAASWALFRGIALHEILAAASWASPDTFVRFYRLDVTRASLAHSVLSVGSNAAST